MHGNCIYHRVKLAHIPIPEEGQYISCHPRKVGTGYEDGIKIKDIERLMIKMPSKIEMT